MDIGLLLAMTLLTPLIIYGSVVVMAKGALAERKAQLAEARALDRALRAEEVKQLKW